ncbi:MAG: right-handed parallel beta-helix repeat-containing protein [Mucilaginibacter sp.]
MLSNHRTEAPINKLNTHHFKPTAAITTIYVAKRPIVLSSVSNVTISGDSINGKSSVCITLNNCSNIHITKCKIMNSKQRGIYLNNCTNVLIDSCFFSNVAVGVYAHLGGQIRVLSNDFLNMRGPLPSGNFVQFNNVTGAGNQINYNKCEDIIGVGANPNPGGGDGISLFQCNGTAASPIQVYGNWIRGGGTNTGSLGMAGIVAGDVGGSYQDIENNILVNSGYVGIQAQGGTNITIMYNQIYSDLVPWSGVGLASANYSGVPSSNNTIGYNTVNWKAGYLNMGQRDTSYKAGSGVNSNTKPNLWNTNTVKASITSSILPAVLIKEYNYPPTPPKVTY